MPVFVGERYLPHARSAAALEDAEQIREAVLRVALEGTAVKLLSTTFVPNEEWTFDLFEAESIEHVMRVYEASGLSVERVTLGTHLPGP